MNELTRTGGHLDTKKMPSFSSKTSSKTPIEPLDHHNVALTLKEKRVLEFLEGYIEQNGIAPTFAEIKDFFNFASFNSVQRYLSQLCRKGYLHIPGGNQKRAIHILKSSDTVWENLKYLKTKNSLSESSKTTVSALSQSPFDDSYSKREVSMSKPARTHGPTSKSLSLPLLGKVAAGLPLEARDFNEHIDVPLHLVNQSQKSFVLKVVGTSMMDEGILDGDLIIIEESVEAKNGELIVATIDDEATVKRIYFHKNQQDGEILVELRPSNPNMESFWIVPSKLNIRGKVISLIRKF